MTYYPVHEISILDLFRNGHDTHYIAQMRDMEEPEVLWLLTRQRNADIRKRNKNRHYLTSWEAA